MPVSFLRLGVACLIGGGLLMQASSGPSDSSDARLRGSFRKPADSGWTFVHLEGSPSAIGFQHGYLLSAEIEDAKRAVELSATHEVEHSWSDLRTVAETTFWPKIPQEYREELQGIAEGLKAHGSKLDVIDLVAMNGWMEFPYYYDELKRRAGIP